MNKKQQIKLIKETWNKIDYCLSSISWGQYGKEYLQLNIREEKSHDNFRGDNSRGISIVTAAKLFAVKQIIEILSGQDKFKPTTKEYLHLRKSIYFAWALIENYGDKLKEALKNVNFDDVLSLDYCKLIEV